MKTDAEFAGTRHAINSISRSVGQANRDRPAPAGYRVDSVDLRGWSAPAAAASFLAFLSARKRARGREPSFCGVEVLYCSV